MKFLILILLPLTLFAGPTFEQTKRRLIRDKRDQKIPESEIRCYEDAKDEDDIKECNKKKKDGQKKTDD